MASSVSLLMVGYSGYCAGSCRDSVYWAGSGFRTVYVSRNTSPKARGRFSKVLEDNFEVR